MACALSGCSSRRGFYSHTPWILILINTNQKLDFTCLPFSCNCHIICSQFLSSRCWKEMNRLSFVLMLIFLTRMTRTHVLKFQSMLSRWRQTNVHTKFLWAWCSNCLVSRPSQDLPTQLKGAIMCTRNLFDQQKASTALWSCILCTLILFLSCSSRETLFKGKRVYSYLQLKLKPSRSGSTLLTSS